MDRSDTLSHAYFLAAPPEEGYAAARELAQALVCRSETGRPCGVCADCRKAQRGIHPDIITVTRPNDEKENRSLHGLTRSLINNMVVGVTEGYKKELEVNGVGYRVEMKGKELVMNLGYSHQVKMPEIEGITIDVPAQNKIVISGPDKQKVGQFAAEVREKRPPEPYKGKGIKYVDETIRRKVGKTGAKK